MVLIVAKVVQYLLSTKLEEEEFGCFHRRVLPAVPVQALKIVVVVWQVLTQVGASALDKTWYMTGKLAEDILADKRAHELGTSDV